MGIWKKFESFQYEVRPYFALAVGVYALVQSEFSSVGAILGLILVLLSGLIVYTRRQYRQQTGAEIERKSREVVQIEKEKTHGIEVVRDAQPSNEWELGTGNIKRSAK